MLYEVVNTETGYTLAVFGERAEAQRLRDALRESGHEAASFQILAVDAHGERVDVDHGCTGRCSC